MLTADFEAATAAMPEKKAVDHVAGLIAILETRQRRPECDSQRVVQFRSKKPRTQASDMEKKAILSWPCRHFPTRNNMSQHFLLSCAARTLSLKAVMRMSDAEVREALGKIRWHDRDGKPFCSRCGCVELYACKTEQRWKCKRCQYRFSVTSGTIFASHKLPLRDLLVAIAIFVNGAKGYSVLQLSRDLDVEYKTAFVLSHRIREALLLIGGNKSGVSQKRFYKQLIARADELFDAHLARLKAKREE